jgi:hypothetical protein
MKVFPTLLVALACLSSAWSDSGGIVIISPGDAEGSGVMNNGGFEDESSTPWKSVGKNTNLAITADKENAYQGEKYAKVQKLFVPPYWTNVAQPTEHVIQANDIYEISFYAKALRDNSNNDKVSWNIFYTEDDKLNGKPTIIASGVSTPLTDAYELNSFKMNSPVPEEAVGKILFISIISDHMRDHGSAAVDNVSLTAGKSTP